MTNTNQGIGVARAMNPAESAHTRRVAAWCAEVSAKLDLPAAERMILEQVVPLHQRTKLVVDEQVWNALRCELGFVPERAAEPSPQDSIMDSIMEVLQSFHGIRPASERIKRLALILEQCDDLDAACELDATVSGDPELNGLDGIVAEVGTYFGGLSEGDLERTASRLPVFSTVAYRAIALLGNEDTNLDDIESLVAADQTLAGHVIRAANSALMSSATRVKGVRQAVTRLGLEASRQIVSAASLRKMFESKHTQALWNHSLYVAENAANIAAQSGLVSRDEAFLAGLMHDVGKLLILNLPSPAVESRERLTLSGCPGSIVERVILGADHATLGAGVLRNWRFAESIAEAVDRHHTPELNASPLSSIVYLAELYPGQVHGIESTWRHQLAREKTRLRAEHARPPISEHSAIAGLRFAAAA
jgi:putative nucleotidyltransferase with HDIG domain